MRHVLLMVVVITLFGLPLLWLSRRGLLGSRNAYVRAQEELRQHGKTLLSPPLMVRLLGVGPLALDVNGLTVHYWRSTNFYSWTSIVEPFTIQLDTRTPRIVFEHCIKNGKFGKRKLFGKPRSEYICVRRTVTSAYAIGWDNLVQLLNEGRTRATEPVSPSILLASQFVESQDVKQPGIPLRSSPAVPDWVIKSGLGIAVIAAFVFMLSRFSWWPDTATDNEPTYAYDGGGSGDGGGGPGPIVERRSNINPAQHVVQGYTRSDGTRVAPHIATNPDQDRTNNLSSRGNTNPYTGTRGHR